eukprot:m.35412 g.35412  ORF g.35412 m.35412 type:complete len:322 (+) comp7448_c0_seq1:2946-3911(+)
MATVQPGSAGDGRDSAVVATGLASPEVVKKVVALQEEGEAWKGKVRHSKRSNINVRTMDRQREESDSLATPLSQRIAKMQEDAEKWKTTKRHSQLPTEAVVKDPNEVGDRGFRRTAGGHIVPAVVKPAGTRRGVSSKSRVTADATVDVTPTSSPTSKPAPAPAPASSTPATTKMDGGAVYATLDFPGDATFEAPSADDRVVYAIIGDEAEGSGGEDTDNSATDEEAHEKNVLYDNADYTGTAGFGHKKQVRAVRRKKGSGTSVNATPEPLATVVPKEDESDSDSEPDDPRLLYDNQDYTGRHPHLQKKCVVRKKKEVEAEC